MLKHLASFMSHKHSILQNLKKTLILKAFTLGILFLPSLGVSATPSDVATSNIVLLSDYGTGSSAPLILKGSLLTLHPSLRIFDFIHNIPKISLWKGGHLLYEASLSWPKDTIFIVSGFQNSNDHKIDPSEAFIALKTKTGHYFLSPNNGLLTLVVDHFEIEEIRSIALNALDPKILNSLSQTNTETNFSELDIFAISGAYLASKQLNFSDLGPLLPDENLVRIHFTKATVKNNLIRGTINAIDPAHGNLYTNIPYKLFKKFTPQPGQNFSVEIHSREKLVFQGIIPFYRSFTDVPKGEPLLYINNLFNVSLALSYKNFAQQHGISSGGDWKIFIVPVNKPSS